MRIGRCSERPQGLARSNGLKLSSPVGGIVGLRTRRIRQCASRKTWPVVWPWAMRPRPRRQSTAAGIMGRDRPLASRGSHAMNRSVFTLAACAAILCGCGEQRSAESSRAANPAAPVPSPGVRAADAWCRPAPRGASTAACYITLTAGSADRLVSVDTPAAARVEIHRMDMEQGVMRMRPVEGGVPLPAGEAVPLAPAGLHLMLITPQADLAAGGRVPLTLRFENAPSLAVTAPVRAAPSVQGSR